ncbi:MAG: alkaline phosphatase D family protein [Alphaproteobacteria bacterium]|nr:alkaline phosphatase D family protein [Alphaproteobacteria bacterium]MBU0795611.1 alkaline phosphatase D family protein [Alphaproteobacteria bacterium]MBU0887668.1 alkaline phosphatase D family protein [Alphaproteobacteria bacterium]MBU1812905.1 alkaline phosphatase D family protein [Alphaproteobacteria bacterium]MBU2088978.1 alkaline phosphatase D family protein [Alphaproteobacteria bacterium]
MRIRRRGFLAGSLATTALLAAPGLIRAAPIRFTDDPFTLGVASGCPRPDSVVLWTRLAPPATGDLFAASALPDAPVEVTWQIAHDEAFAKIAAEGVAVAEPGFGHSVHVVVSGLEPGRWYFYRFQAGGARSPVGRTRTAPAPGAALQKLRLAFASCQQYEHGYFTAFRHMAAQDFDLVLHLGDYVYEASWGKRYIRQHGTGIPTQLWEWRDRYALYKTDPDLQAAHAAAPWLAIWDDHEVANNYANDHSPKTSHPGQFLDIRAAAYQAWYEHMPVPPSMAPSGPALRIYDRYRFGDLLDLALLDDRQYRDAHPCGLNRSGIHDCDERFDDKRSLLGREQEAWLDGALKDAQGRWTVIAQQTLMAELDRKPGPEKAYNLDGWDGYVASRDRLLSAIDTHRPANPLVLGGDVHAFWVADLKQDFADPASPTVATEVVCTSISSQGPSDAGMEAGRKDNPHIRYGRGDKRGYASLELTPKQALFGLEAVDQVDTPAGTVSRLASFAVEAGKPGAERA